jgi:uncharacterized membrane protein
MHMTATKSQFIRKHWLQFVMLPAIALLGLGMYQVLGAQAILALGHGAKTHWLLMLLVRLCVYALAWQIIKKAVEKSKKRQPDDIKTIRVMCLRIILVYEFLFGINVISLINQFIA